MDCVRCGSPLFGPHCLSCGAVYVTECPLCGNRDELEEVELGLASGLRCPRCANTGDFRVVALDDEDP